MGTSRESAGFTLIEMSIVLVIIGLVVGGVLVGQDLVRASNARALISQIEKYQTAVHTFQEKFGGLPGDLNAGLAAQYGFISRGPNGCGGSGDGNGLIEGLPSGCWGVSAGVGYDISGGGETSVFWVDLSSARLIEGNFSSASEAVTPPWPIAGTTIGLYLPEAKLGGGNYIYVMSNNDVNYFGVENIASIANGASAGPGLTVQQAYQLDSKVDDGLPQTGRVTAIYTGQWGGPHVWWICGGSSCGYNISTTQGALPGTAATASVTSCYDNGGNVNALMQYSVSQSNGSGVNCALSFQFQ